MDTTTMNNIGTGSHFWVTAIAFAITFIAVILPVILMLWKSFILILNDDYDPKKRAYLMPSKALVIWTLAGILFTIAFWSAWGEGRELDIYTEEDEGHRKMTLEEFPDEKPVEQIEEEAEEWKSKSQKDFEEKLTKQEDPQSVLEKALERAAKREGEKK